MNALVVNVLMYLFACCRGEVIYIVLIECELCYIIRMKGECVCVCCVSGVCVYTLMSCTNGLVHIRCEDKDNESDSQRNNED